MPSAEPQGKIASRSGNPTPRAFSAGDYGLYALTVFVWRTSWLALKFQIGVVDPQVSLVWRFAPAALIMLVVCKLSGRRLVYPWRMHWRFAGLGILLFSSNFLMFYYAANWLVSGLLSVIFSLASVINIVLAVTVLDEPLRPRVVVGALFGLAGMACLFGPEIADQDFGGGALIGLGLGICGTTFFCIGNMISAANQKAGIPVISASAIGMVYGAGFSTLIALAAGSAFVIEPTARYLGGLAWLIVFSTVIAFWAYLTLLGRIGADRAGYATVVFPVVALIISTFVEGYQWSVIGLIGVALVAIGNTIILMRRRRA
jgi:drug/metabolite transporter (DMT)-like permease